MNRIERIVSVAAVAGFFAIAAAGCASQGPNVPSSAMGVATGGQDVSYTVPQDGKVYLQDDFNKRLVWSGEVRQGESVRFDQRQDDVFLNGAVAAQAIPMPWHQHTIYFEATPQPQHAAANASGTGISTNSTLKVPVKVEVQTQPAPEQ